MGRNQPPKSWQGKWQDGSSKHWDYWQGAWPAWEKTKGKGKQAAASSSAQDFPKYQDMVVQETAGKHAEQNAQTVNKDLEATSAQQDYLRAIQKALNSNRRLENKMRKLKEDRQRREQCWADYQKKLKASFLAQFKEFKADIERIDAELLQVSQQQQEAVELVSNLAEGGQLPTRMDEDEVPTPEEESTWAQLLQLGSDIAPVADEPWEKFIGMSPCPTTVAKEMVAELKEASAIQDEMFRSRLRAMQQEISDLKRQQTHPDLAGHAAVLTPERKPSAGLELTPPPTTRTHPIPTAPPTSSTSSAITSVQTALPARPGGELIGCSAGSGSPAPCYAGVSPAARDPYMCSPGIRDQPM